MKCESCGYEWEPRVKDPKACPRCKRYLSLVPARKIPKKEARAVMAAGGRMI